MAEKNAKNFVNTSVINVEKKMEQRLVLISLQLQLKANNPSVYANQNFRGIYI